MTEAPEAQSVTKRAGPGSPPDDYRDRFLTILNNRGKVEKGRDLPIREKGFVVLARDGLDLTPLQTLCTDTRQTWNVCLTARYRLRPGAIFGTLLNAFLSDLDRIHQDKTDEVIGDLSPGAAHTAWMEFLEQAGDNLLFDLPVEGEPLTKRRLDQLLNILTFEGTLSRGRRLVLFAEVDSSEVPADKQEWEMAARTLFDRLPERVGLVFSGAPKDFRLDSAPHFLELALPEGALVDPPPPETIRFKQSSLHSDQPAREDMLGVKNFAEALARFVMHPQTEPPLTIGIHGPWGKGKSSFMNLLEDSLIEQALAGRDAQRIHELTQLEEEIEQEVEQGTQSARLRRRHREKMEEWVQLREELAAPNVLTVEFNAWQYEDARQIWAGLASVISARLERALPRWGHVLMRIRYALKERLSELLLYVALPLLVGLVILVLYLAFGYPAQLAELPKDAAASDKVLRVLFASFLPFGTSLFLIWYATKQFLSVAQPLSERVLSYIRLPDYREQMGYQHRVMDDLRFVYGSLERHGLESKVVVFIDDLDRCSEEKIMEVLQAIVLILGDSEFFVFLGMDTEMIHRAIRVHYTLHQEEGEAKPLPDDFSEEYLRKIVQVSFNLPEATEDARRAYLDSLFSERSRQQAIEEPAPSDTAGLPDETARTNGNEGHTSRDTPPTTEGGLPSDLGHLHKPKPLEVEDTPAELETFRGHLELLEDNPREVKRLINLHRLVKIILQTEQQSISRENEQRKLVRWLIFCACWPDLIDKCFEKARQSPKEPDILEALIDELGQSNALVPSLRKFKGLAKSDDTFSAQDIGSFKLAASISTLVRESVATPGRGDPGPGA